MPSFYEIITDKIIKQLESGVAPWRKPWTCQTPANLITQKEYRGLKVFTRIFEGFGRLTRYPRDIPLRCLTIIPALFDERFTQPDRSVACRMRSGVQYWSAGDSKNKIPANTRAVAPPDRQLSASCLRSHRVARYSIAVLRKRRW
jgi:hypothetical protein